MYFVRHAHSSYTPEEYKRPLSEAGYKEAHKVAKFFESIDINAIYSSKYKRATETVQPIATAKNLHITELEALNERTLANFKLPDFENAIVKVWSQPTYSFPGGESNMEAQNRVIPTIEELQRIHKNETIIIGTHGNIFTLILNHYNKAYDLAFWEQLKMPDIIKVEFNDGHLSNVTILAFK